MITTIEVLAILTLIPTVLMAWAKLLGSALVIIKALTD